MSKVKHKWLTCKECGAREGIPVDQFIPYVQAKLDAQDTVSDATIKLAQEYVLCYRREHGLEDTMDPEFLRGLFAVLRKEREALG